MWFDGVNFGIIFITSIFLSNQGFVECDIDCHENDAVHITGSFLFTINLYRVKHRTVEIKWYDILEWNTTAPRWAKSLAPSGKIIEDYLDNTYTNQYMVTFGHVEGIPYENDGINITQNITKQWYEEKKNYNGHSYSPEIANFTRMLWNGSNTVTCGICSKDENSHYIVCIYQHLPDRLGEFVPVNNSDPTPEEFKKNVFFINDEPTTRTPTSNTPTIYPSTHNNFEKETTTEHSRSTNQKPPTHTPTSNSPTIYSSTHNNFEKETTIEHSRSTNQKPSPLIIHNLNVAIANAELCSCCRRDAGA